MDPIFLSNFRFRSKKKFICKMILCGPSNLNSSTAQLQNIWKITILPFCSSSPWSLPFQCSRSIIKPFQCYYKKNPKWYNYKPFNTLDSFLFFTWRLISNNIKGKQIITIFFFCCRLEVKLKRMNFWNEKQKLESQNNNENHGVPRRLAAESIKGGFRQNDFHYSVL